MSDVLKILDRYDAEAVDKVQDFRKVFPRHFHGTLDNERILLLTHVIRVAISEFKIISEKDYEEDGDNAVDRSNDAIQEIGAVLGGEKK